MTEKIDTARVVRMVTAEDEEGRLVIRFTGNNTVEISGRAGSADMALAGAVLSRLAVKSLEED